MLKIILTITLTFLFFTSHITYAQDITGIYNGHYFCQQGKTSLQLGLVDEGNGSITGVFSFYPVGGNPQRPKGVFELKGSYDKSSGNFELNPAKWIKRPPGYVMVGMKGNLSDTKKLDGNITLRGCSNFSLKKDNSKSEELKSTLATKKEVYKNAPSSLSKAKTDAERCIVFNKWSSRFPIEYPDLDIRRTQLGKVYPKAINLFTDKHFVPVFGKPFDQMSQQERFYIGRKQIRKCFLTKEYSYDFPWQRNIIDRPFSLTNGSFSYGEVASEVSYRRQLIEELKKEVSNLNSLPNSSESYRNVLTIQQNGKNKYSVLWPSEYKRFLGSASEARKRNAASAFTDIVNSTAGDLESYKELTALNNVVKDNPLVWSDLSPEIQNKEQKRIMNKIQSALVGYMQAERNKIDNLGSGLKAVENGTNWYRQFVSKFVDKFQSSKIDKTLSYFGKRRSNDLANAERNIVSLINSSDNATETRKILSKYTGTAFDSETTAGLNIKEAGDNKFKVFAAQHQQEEEEKRRRPCKEFASSEISAPAGPPTQEEMCTALWRKVEAINSHYDELGARCQNREFENNPLLAMQCLQLCGASAGKCDINVKITKFQKIACKKAVGEAGFNCDYLMSIYSNAEFVQASLETFLPYGGTAQGRFIRQPGGWLFLGR